MKSTTPGELEKKYPKRNGLGIQCGELWKYDIKDVSVSDTQAAMVVSGRLYTWGPVPEILGHPPLPLQNSIMRTPDVEDVVHGSTHPEDYLQREKFENILIKFRKFHEIECQKAGLEKDGFDETWLEYPKDADELWSKLQHEWHRQLALAGPRLLRSEKRGVPHHHHHNKQVHVRSVVCGTSHTLALTRRGTLLVWGVNNNGCLGLGDRVPNGATQRLPLPVALNLEGDGGGGGGGSSSSSSSSSPRYDVALIAAGGAHSAMLLRDGRLYTWGSNHFGQLGHRHFDDLSRPKMVSLAPDNVYKKQCTIGKRLRSRGSGSGSSGASTAAEGKENDTTVGQERKVNRIRFVSKKEKKEKELEEKLRKEEEKNKWQEIPFVSVSLGQDHTLGLTENGEVYSCGGNWRGQLGRLTKLKHSGDGPNWKQHLVINAMRANWSVSRVVSKIALKARSKTKMRDAYPKKVQLEGGGEEGGEEGGGGGDDHFVVVSICAHGHASAALLEDGTVYTWGRVAVPKHAVVKTKEKIGRDQGHDGTLADRPLPVRNDLLKMPHHHAIEVSVTEMAVVAIYDRVRYQDRTLNRRSHEARTKEESDDSFHARQREAQKTGAVVHRRK